MLSDDQLMEMLDRIANKTRDIKGKKKKREILLEHLLEHGWYSNYKYIESQKQKGKAKNNEEDVDFNVLIRGEYKGDYHLITKCEKYTVRLRLDAAVFWRKDSWLKLCELPIEEIELTDKGIRCEIITVEAE